MTIFTYFFLLNFFRDILILSQVLLIFYLALREIKKNLKQGFFFLLRFFLIFILVFFIVGFLKDKFPEVRPLTYLGFSLEEKNSFPSRHTALSFALTFLLLYYDFKFFLFSLAISLLISVLSIVSLAHWPQDVIFGFLIGFLLALIFQEGLNFFHRLNAHKFKPKT